MSKRAKSRSAGFTLTEVVVASSLLIVAMVPILKGLTSVHLTASLVEQRTNSLNFALTVLDDIRAHLVYDYNGNYNQTNQDLGDSYLYTSNVVVQSPDLKKITVTAGYDKDDDGSLQPTEVLIMLDTLIAERW